jgi:REP element-mobilizing transposase RayT
LLYLNNRRQLATQKCLGRRKNGSKLKEKPHQANHEPVVVAQPIGVRLTSTSSEPMKLRNWPHSPAHYLRNGGTYIVTAGTYNHANVFRGCERLTKLTNHILELAERYAWSLQAWAVFPNHYHLVGRSEAPESMQSFLQDLHSITAIEANKLDQTSSRFPTILKCPVLSKLFGVRELAPAFPAAVNHPPAQALWTSRNCGETLARQEAHPELHRRDCEEAWPRAIASRIRYAVGNLEILRVEVV